MKTLKLIVTIATVCIVQSAAHAELQQVWQVDLTPYLDGYPTNYINSHRFTDGNVGLISKNDYPDQSGRVMVVNSSDGSLLSAVNLTETGSAFLGNGSSKNFIIQKDYDGRVNLFERSAESLTFTTISGHPSVESSSGETKNFFMVNGVILTKWQFTDGEPIIQQAEMGVYGANFIISWDSEAGSTYRVQTSTNLVDWANIGIPLSGTGSTMNWANPVTNSASYYRLILE